MAWTTAEIPSQRGRLAVVTGANSGIGWRAALELARAGAEVILTVRSEAKGRDAVERVRREVSQANVRWELLDLASLASVRNFAAKIQSEAKLDLLVNNAGVMNIPQREVTEDGFERQLATNFLGHFALTGLLLPVLLRASVSGATPRAVMVSSLAATVGLKRIRLEDMQWEHDYSPWAAYCQSKLADLMFALELSRRVAQSGWELRSNAAHPGLANTNILSAGSGKPVRGVARSVQSLVTQSAARGALPVLRAATDPNAATGSYYGPRGFHQLWGSPVRIPIPKPAADTDAARQLWETAESLTGVTFPTASARQAPESH